MRKQPVVKDPGILFTVAIDPHGVEAARARLAAKFAAVSKIVNDGIAAHTLDVLPEFEKSFVDGFADAIGSAPNAFERAAQRNGKSPTADVLAVIAADFEAKVAENAKAYVDAALIDDPAIIPDAAARAEFYRLLQQTLAVQ